MPEIILKPTVADDYDEYYKIRCSPGDIYWNGYESEPDKEQFRALFLSRLGNSRFERAEDRRLFLIRLSDPGINVGFLQLIKRTDGIDISYTVTEQFRGNGYAAEALLLGTQLARMTDKRVYVQIRDDNTASRRVAVKCGFIMTDEYEVRDYPGAGKVLLRKYRLPI